MAKNEIRPYTTKEIDYIMANYEFLGPAAIGRNLGRTAVAIKERYNKTRVKKYGNTDNPCNTDEDKVARQKLRIKYNLNTAIA